MSLIKINNLNIVRDERQILSDVNLTINEGDFVLFSGISGSGKTTLINEIVDLYPGLVGRVFQDASQQFAMETPFLEMVFLLENLNTPADQIEEIANRALVEFHLDDKSNQNVNSLSGGEQQRLALAEAIYTQSQFLILDEPFASVDPINREFLLNKIASLDKTIIVSDHDPSVYEKMATRIITFKNGDISELPKSSFTSFFKEFKHRARIVSNLSDEQSKLSIKDMTIDPLFFGATLNIPNNSHTLLYGENGIGKSTFLKSLVNLNPYKGSIKNSFSNTLLAFQHAEDSFITITVADEIEFAVKHQFNPIDINVDQWLERLNLQGKDEQSVYTLSGGEQKKLQILTLVIQNPELLLLDEPFAGLDNQSVKDVLELLANEQQTQILVSHQLAQLDSHINNILQIKNQKIESLTEVNQ